MSSIVDTAPYPWHLPLAQELHLVLSEIYPTAKAAVFVAQKSGLRLAELHTEESAFYLWQEILEAAAAATKTRNLVEEVRRQKPDNPRQPFLDSLLRDTVQPLDRDPRGVNGAPRFITDTDAVTEQEALLFHDDLSLPIGRVNWLIGVLRRLLDVAPAVCRMHTTVLGDSQLGTAFRIGNDLLLTNWHVIHFGTTRSAEVIAEFGFEDDGKGGTLASTALQCDVSSVRGSAADDWAIIRTSAPIPANLPMLKLSSAVAPAINAPAFIIQHPGGQRKRLTYIRNQITAFDARVVQYLSDTQTGSSGAPVLSDTGHLIAMHHAGGRPQEVAGKPPLKKNEGIRISAIASGLLTLGVAFD